MEWVVWHPKGDVVLAGSEDFTMWMWLAASGQCMQVFSGHSGPVVAGAFTPDGKAVVSVGGEGDATLRVWNPKTGECVSTLQGHPFHSEGLTCMGLSPDGSAAITGAQDGSLRVSNIQSGRVLAAPAGAGLVGSGGVGTARQPGLCIQAALDHGPWRVRLHGVAGMTNLVPSNSEHKTVLTQFQPCLSHTISACVPHSVPARL